MGVIAVLKRALSRPTPLAKPDLEGLSEGFYPDTARRNVAKRSQGNVRLAQGRYRTQQDVDEAFDRVKDVDFTQ